MKKLLLSAALFVCTISIAQTIVYSEDFSTGSTWTLNTVVGAEGTYPNAWYISCQEDGQSAGVCGTACSTFDNSLHVSANSILGDMGAAYFEGLGTTTNRRAESGNISTIGQTGLTLSFDMIGAGNAQDFCALFYSVNGGATWQSLAPSLTSLCCGGVACTGTLQGLWQTNTYSLPASCENISNLRIAFVWQNLDDGIATDPSFAVDDIVITTASAAASITTSTLSQTEWCYGVDYMDVLNFTATGTFNSGNIFTAELSDASGSFAAPTIIGALPSASSGNLSINITIPGTVPAGSGYRVRVNASDPATTGADNGTDLVIHDLPTVSLGAFSDVCVYTPSFNLTGGTPTGGTYSGLGVSSNVFNPTAAGLGTHSIVYSYVDVNGCSSSDTSEIVVDGCASIEELQAKMTLFPNPASTSFVIEGVEGIEAVRLMDLSGRIVLHSKASKTVSIEGIPGGTYFVQVETSKALLLSRITIQ